MVTTTAIGLKMRSDGNSRMLWMLEKNAPRVSPQRCGSAWESFAIWVSRGSKYASNTPAKKARLISWIENCNRLEGIWRDKVKGNSESKHFRDVQIQDLNPPTWATVHGHWFWKIRICHSFVPMWLRHLPFSPGRLVDTSPRISERPYPWLLRSCWCTSKLRQMARRVPSFRRLRIQWNWWNPLFKLTLRHMHFMKIWLWYTMSLCQYGIQPEQDSEADALPPFPTIHLENMSRDLKCLHYISTHQQISKHLNAIQQVSMHINTDFT